MAGQGASDLELGIGIWENVPLTVRQAFIALNDSALAQARRIRLLERNADLREDLVKKVLAAVDDRLRGLDLFIKPSPPSAPAAPSPELLKRLDELESKIQSLAGITRRFQAIEDAQSSAYEMQGRLEGKLKSTESDLSKLTSALEGDSSKLASFETRYGNWTWMIVKEKPWLWLTLLHLPGWGPWNKSFAPLKTSWNTYKPRPRTMTSLSKKSGVSKLGKSFAPWWSPSKPRWILPWDKLIRFARVCRNGQNVRLPWMPLKV